MLSLLPTGRSFTQRARAALRAPCRALITPHAVVLDAGGKHAPWVQRCADGASAPELPDRFALAVTDLFALMDQAQVRGRRVQVAVSDAWARPLVVTLPAKPANDAAVDALLASHYRKTYGDLMTGWRACWSQHDTRLVGVAWPAAALDALHNGLAQRGCVLASARSQGVVLGAPLASEPGACWLALLARSHVSLMRLQSGVLQDWWVVSGAGDATSLAVQWPLQLARQAARRGDACRALVTIDCDAAHDLPAVRQSLLEVGWSSRVCASAELANTWAWRLQQKALLPHAA